VTYEQLRRILRHDLLAEVASDYWGDGDLLSYLRRAATEVAHELAFPVETFTVAVSADAGSFELPAGAAVIQVGEVSYGGMRLDEAPPGVVEEYRANTHVGAPRYYSFDPKVDSRTVHFGPVAPDAGSFAVRFVQEYDAESDELDDEPWGGLFRRYHELLAYRAAVKAFEASLENDRAMYMLQRSQPIFMSFAIFLGRSDMGQLALVTATTEATT
jgi:hypothetical protein